MCHVHLCLCWGAVADAGVAALAVVEDLNVLEELRPGLLPGLEPRAMDHFGLEGAEEAFHRRVVQAIAFAAHRGRDVMQPKQFSVGTAGVLDASIGMVNELRRRPSVGDSRCLSNKLSADFMRRL